MGKKVLMLLSNEFKPDVRVDKEAKTLAEEGHQVTILAWNRLLRMPESESSKGYQVRRVGLLRIDRRWKLPIGFPSFSLLAVWHGLRSRPEIVHCHDMDTLPQGALIAWLKQVPLVYDAHEHYAKMIEQNLPTRIARFLDIMESRLVPRATLVVAANECIAQYLTPYARKMPVVVMNAVDLGAPPIYPAKDSDGKIVLSYTGALEPLRYLEELMEAVDGRPSIILRIAGSGSLHDEVVKRAESSKNIVFLGNIPQTEVRKEMLASDAIIVLFDPRNENNRIGTPNRLFEAMASGRPVLVTKGTLSGKIAEEEGCGIVMEWSSEAFDNAISILSDKKEAERMGRRGREAAERAYNWPRMSGILVQAYEGLVNKVPKAQ